MSKSFEQMASQLEGILGYRPGEDYLRPLILQLQEYDRLLQANGSAPGRLTSTRTDTQAIFQLIQKLYELAQAEKPADGSKAFLEQVAIARGKYVAGQRRAEARKRTAGRVAAGLAGASVMAALANAAGATPDLHNVPEPLRQVLEALAVIDEDPSGGAEAPASVPDTSAPLTDQLPTIVSDDSAAPEGRGEQLSSESPALPVEAALDGVEDVEDGGPPNTAVDSLNPSETPVKVIAVPPALPQPSAPSGQDIASKNPVGGGATVDPPVGPPAALPPEQANANPEAPSGPPAENPAPTVPSGPPVDDGPGWSEQAPGRVGDVGVPDWAPGSEHRPVSPGQSAEAPGQQGDASNQQVNRPAATPTPPGEANASFLSSSTGEPEIPSLE